jgi:hypothetical protein
MRVLLSLLCLTGCVGCLVVFGWVRHEAVDEDNRKGERWTVGLPSPWLVLSSEEKTAEEQKGNKVVWTKTTSDSRKVQYLSASWLFLLGAVALGCLFLGLLSAGISAAVQRERIETS